MKTTLYGLSLLCFFFLSTTSKAQQHAHPINGVWLDSNSTAFTNGYAIISVDQQGNVFMTHYVEFNGVPMVEKGIGKLQNKTITYDVLVTKAIPGWSTQGMHQLTLSDDGQTLRGIYKDNKGNSGPLVFKKAFK